MVLPFKGVGYEVFTMTTGQSVMASGRRETCSTIDLNMAECMEAYGLVRGSEKCIKYMEDVAECKYYTLRRFRAAIMKEQVARKLLNGELTWAERHGPKYSYDSFIQGTFYP